MPPKWLPTKKRFRLFTPVDVKSFSLNERLVYSYLAYRDRKGFGASARRLERETGLDRTDTVLPALGRLQERGLVRDDGRQWIALPPPEGMFFDLKIGVHWSQRIGYVWYLPPKTTLTTAQAYLLWTAVAHQERTFNVTGLVGFLGLSKPTVLRALEILEELGALQRVSLGGYKFRLEIRSIPRELFHDRPAKKQDPVANKLDQYMERDEIPPALRRELIPALIKTSDPLGFFMKSFQGHQHYLKTHPAGARHCGYRIKIDLQNSHQGSR